MPDDDIVLVLGKQLGRNGEVPDELVRQMEKAIKLMQTGKGDLLVIAGGVTLPGLPSEAEAAMTLVPEELKPRVRLETRSLSTKQNICFVKNLLADIRVGSIIVVSSPGHKKRTRWLFRREWPEAVGSLSFENVVVPQTVSQKILGRLIHEIIFLLTVLDPDERVFLPLKRKYLSG